jgi:hypothetical protein
MSHSIENQQICLRVDDRGRPFEFYNKDRGENYLRRHDFWRLIVQDEQCLEIEVVPGDSPAQITTQDGRMTIRHTDIRERFSHKPLSVELTVTLALDGDQLSAGVSVTNQQAGAIVKEVHFPLLAIREESIKGVVTTYTGGQYFKDVKAKILKAHTQFKGIDQTYIRDVNCYPTNAMNCMLADRGHEGLYIGCHDQSFQLNAHILELDHNRDFNMAMARSPHLPTGETYQFNDYVLSPYRGNWRTAADKYRNWAECWYRAPERPDFIKSSNGWQRIIMKTQFGRVLFPYDGLQKPFEDAKSAGIDTLFLFGWPTHGMDNGYPDYSCDEHQGGRAALKKSIRQIQAQGGKIILYFNGQLIDRKSSFYKSEGLALATKVTNGEPELHHYAFPGPGITAAKFGNCSFTTACPSSETWLGVLKSFIDMAIDLEVDSVFFDQIGNTSYPCCDPSHGHPVPYVGINEARMHQLSELRRYLKKQRPDMGFGVEWLSDVTAQHVDFVHIWGSIAELDPATVKEGEKPHSIGFQEFFHYAFPEIVFSNREIRTDEDIERRVNLMLLKGCCSDVEVYRCQDTIAETPHYREYLGLANAFRDKFRPILTEGRFLADLHLPNLGNQAFSCASWQSGQTLAVMLTQSHLDQASGTLGIPGYRLLEHDSVRGDATVVGGANSWQITLPRHSMAILILEKSEDSA